MTGLRTNFERASVTTVGIIASVVAARMLRANMPNTSWAYRRYSDFLYPSIMGDLGIGLLLFLVFGVPLVAMGTVYGDPMWEQIHGLIERRGLA